MPPILLRGVLLLTIGVAACATGSAIAKPPNVIVILADDLGYGDLGCYGATDIRTPFIDQLARDGSRFTSFYVAQPVCTASRAALMTGCYSNRVGMSGALNHTSLTGIHPDERLLSTLFRERGYATAIFGKWHLGHQPPFLPTRRGFDVWEGIPYSNDNGPLHPVTRGIPALPWYRNEDVVERDPDQATFTRRLTDLAVAFMEQNRERPFFLYLPHIMPHVPIFASSRFLNASRRGLYGDVVQELDWSVGQIVTTLDRLGLARDTIILFTSDNGPFLSYGEHAGSSGPLREGKLTTFEGGVRVPCLIRWPGRIPAGRDVAEVVSEIDLLPTFASLLDVPVPDGVRDGVNLLPLLLGEPGARGRKNFWYYSGQELHAVRRGPWKLHVPHEYLTVAAEPGRGGKPSNFGRLTPRSIEESGIRGIASRHGYRVESLELSLFHLDDDPGERNNLAAQHPDRVAELMQEVERARADLGDSLTGRTATRARPIGKTQVDR